MKETEVTVQVFDDLIHVDQTLRSLGYVLAKQYVIRDLYFSKHANVLSLSYKDLMKESFLLRSVEGPEPEKLLIYKKKEIDGRGVAVSEEKVKTAVESIPAAAEIFRLSGLFNYCEIVNRSFIYENGNVCFAVQAVDDLGVFIEYEEDETMKDLQPEQKIRLLTNVLRGLGLELGNDFSCKKVFMKLHKE